MELDNLKDRMVNAMSLRIVTETGRCDQLSRGLPVAYRLLRQKKESELGSLEVGKKPGVVRIYGIDENGFVSSESKSERVI
jgi:hypothetical protein